MKYGLTNQEAIEAIKKNYPPENYTVLREALDMSIEALEHEELLEEAVKLTRDRLDAILNWLESPCPYKKTSYSQLRKMMGYEYARQKVFEILITPEVE